MANIDPSKVKFRDITEFIPRPEVTGLEQIQVSSTDQVSLHDIASLAQTSGMVVSANTKALAYTINRILLDLMVIGLDSTTNRLYVKTVENKVEYKEPSAFRRWGLSITLEKLSGEEILESIDDFITLYIIKTPADPDYSSYIPVGVQTFMSENYQATINWDAISLVPKDSGLVSTGFFESGIKRSQLFTVANLFGRSLLPVSQRLLTRSAQEYNVSEFHTHQGQKTFTLQEAVQVVPNDIRKLNLKITFLTIIEFKIASSLPPIVVNVTYQYNGQVVNPTSWLLLANWSSASPIVLTEEQHANLKNVALNTMYYVEEARV